jgi:hypothetical protein
VSLVYVLLWDYLSSIKKDEVKDGILKWGLKLTSQLNLRLVNVNTFLLISSSDRLSPLFKYFPMNFYKKYLIIDFNGFIFTMGNKSLISIRYFNIYN